MDSKWTFIDGLVKRPQARHANHEEREVLSVRRSDDG